MSHHRLVRSLLADVTVGALAASVMVGVSLVAPDWVVGVLALGLVPLLVVGVFAVSVASVWLSRRQESETPLTSPDRDVSPDPFTRGTGARQPNPTVAGRNPSEGAR